MAQISVVNAVFDGGDVRLLPAMGEGRAYVESNSQFTLQTTTADAGPSPQPAVIGGEQQMLSPLDILDWSAIPEAQWVMLLYDATRFPPVNWFGGLTYSYGDYRGNGRPFVPIVVPWRNIDDVLSVPCGGFTTLFAQRYVHEWKNGLMENLLARGWRIPDDIMDTYPRPDGRYIDCALFGMAPCDFYTTPLFTECYKAVLAQVTQSMYDALDIGAPPPPPQREGVSALPFLVGGAAIVGMVGFARAR